MGKTYKVWPVVALVEGVLHGQNSAYPELALASEFGKFPEGWDGRPLVLNHPQVNGEFVSANSPSVLESYALGFMFNSRVQDGKLKSEAWFDVQAIEQKGGEAARILKELEDGDRTIEVSTGLYTHAMRKKGKYKGKAYESVWTNVVPDHLAILSDAIGACSVEDGCGIPRLNQGSEAIQEAAQEAQEVALIKTSSGCSCQPADTATTNSVVLNLRNAGFAVNSIPDGMLLSDVMNSLSESLTEYLNAFDMHGWVTTATSSEVVFLGWGMSDDSIRHYSLEYAIDDQGVVTFQGEPRKVRLITKIVSVNADASGDDLETLEAGASEETASQEQKLNEALESTAKESPMSDQTLEGAIAAPSSHAPISLEAFVNSAPSHLIGVLQQSVKLNQAHRSALVTKILAASSKFSQQSLEAMDNDILEGIASMIPDETPAVSQEPVANAASKQQQPLSFAARSGGNDGLRQNEDSGYAPAPKIFEVKTVAL